MKMTPTCLPPRDGSGHVALDDPDWPISKSDLRPVQVRSRSGRYPNRSLCISPELAWRDKSLGTICVTLAVSCYELLAKNLIVTSCDLRWPSRAPRSSAAPGSSQIGWVVLMMKELGGGGVQLVDAKREAFSYFPIGLQCKWGCHETDLIWGHQDKKNPRNVRYRYWWPHAILEVS